MLNDFMATFVGYGSLDAKTWFIGIEEGGGKSTNELMQRVSIWSAQGAGPTLDLFSFHQALGMPQFFGPQARLQKTWACLSRIMLIRRGVPSSTDAIRVYQSSELGRHVGETLLAELMPLPKPSQSSWPYQELGESFAFLKSPTTYLEAIRPQRIQLLRQAIQDRRPPVVIFYGMSCLRHWRGVANVEFSDTGYGSLSSFDDKTFFYAIKHPNARGITNEYFEVQGRLIANTDDPTGKR